MTSEALLVSTFTALALAICAIWMKPLRVLSMEPWILLLGAAIILGLMGGFLSWPAVAAIGVLIVTSANANSPALPATVRLVAFALVLLVVAFLATHSMPGFHNPRLLHEFKFSPDAAPYTHYASFDKGVAGLILLAYFCSGARDNKLWGKMLLHTAPIAFITCVAVVSMGVSVGYARLDIKLPAYTPVFLLTNLFFTCVAEEALFRGVLQERLQRWLNSKNFERAGLLAIAITSLIFGLVHTGGGLGYMALAALASVGYGYAYHRTGRIESPILVHFSVNATHFLGFTYPRLV